MSEPALALGTRGSALALAQARLVTEALAPLAVEIVEITTAGDRGEERQDKSRWVSELERALLAGEIDAAVHSAKDVPGELPSGLEIVAIPEREDPRDALVGARSVAALAPRARVGTSSLRRIAQLRATRDDLEVVELRGNVDTRLRKLDAGEIDAIVVAAAGLRRLGFDERIDATLDAIPAPAQGALAIQARSDDEATKRRLAPLVHSATTVCVNAERAFCARIGASCHTPVGAHATLDGERLTLAVFIGLPDGSAWLRDEHSGSSDDASGLARTVAERMSAAGARELLDQAQEQVGSR